MGRWEHVSAGRASFRPWAASPNRYLAAPAARLVAVLLRAIREHWPHTHITIRGDIHYGRPEVMEWCDENGIDFVFGLAGNDVLRRLVEPRPQLSQRVIRIRINTEQA